MITFRLLGKLGRFGNMLFQVAGTIGIALRNNEAFAFPPFINYDHRDRFGSDEDCDLEKYFLKRLPYISLEEIERRKFQRRFIHWGYHDVMLSKYNDWDIEGHLQSEKYFSHCIDTVRAYLTMKDEYKQTDRCAIHWRAGDYAEGANNYHPRQIKNYYVQAMKHFPEDQQYIIFTDDPEGFYKMFPHMLDSIYSDGKNYIDDFKFMKSFKHFIVANSSFSMMAAILADQPGKKIVAPSLWFGADAGNLSPKDIYPEGCIVI